MKRIEVSGIRRAFDLSKAMVDPINLSIGLPDFDVPAPLKAAAIDAIVQGHNAYTLTMGTPPLRTRLRAQIDTELGHGDRDVIVTAGTSGGLLLALCATVNPGDEVIIFDPYFVMYNNLVELSGGTPVLVDTYPDFHITAESVRAAMTPRTKCVILNSPNNPTGVVANAAEAKAIAELCHARGVLLISDEVYRLFCYESEFVSPARWNDQVLVVDGFSKAYGMTGWRLGFAHGPSRLIAEMAKLQQFSFVCAPAPLQHAVTGALDLDMRDQVAAYRQKRDRVVAGLAGHYEMSAPAGAFYAFPKVPARYENATQFVAAAIEHNLIVIPGSVFSRRDTHFRISYAVSDEMLDRGLEVLCNLAR